MTTVKTSKGGIDYLKTVLRDKARVVSRAMFWRIPHDSGVEDIRLKLGRYNRGVFNIERVEIDNPRSELTLDNEEFQALIAFLQQNYEPFKAGVREYVTLHAGIAPEDVTKIQDLFANPNRAELLEIVARNELIPEDLLLGLEHTRRVKAVDEFEGKLGENRTEHDWQRWFKENSWVLGSEFVRVLDGRSIDVENIADYLMEAYDGFLDIVEIKRPGADANFWAKSKDHDNYVPHSDLVKAITQASNYLYAVELEANSVKFAERMAGVSTVKPRCVLVFGRSADWDDEKRRACRILNAGFHNLTILTYDHVLTRARRMLAPSE